jgi:hypothetical protein
VRAANAERNAAIFQRFEAGETFTKIAGEFDLCPSRVRMIVRTMQRERVRRNRPMLTGHEPDLLERSVELIRGLNQRTINCLLNESIATVGALRECTPARLLRIPSFGAVCMREVQNGLGALGLSLSDETALVDHRSGRHRNQGASA